MNFGLIREVMQDHAEICRFVTGRHNWPVRALGSNVLNSAKGDEGLSILSVRIAIAKQTFNVKVTGV